MKRVISIVVALGAAGVAAAATPLDPNDTTDALTIGRKIQCSTVDGEAITYMWTGDMYSRRQGERDRRLFSVEGMNVRACVAAEDPKRGKGYRLVSREIMLYKDPKTGEVLSTWDNPWTGETVDVLHVANDPVNFGNYEIGRGGQPYTWGGIVHGDMWRDRFTVPLYYPNPLASEYQNEIGGIYHNTEMFGFFGRTSDLLDRDKTTAQVHVAWTRMGDWLPWMKMSGREGLVYVNASGVKLASWDELSDTMKNEIRIHYPDYVAPPPLDDARRNETSWIYFKRVREGEREAPKR